MEAEWESTGQRFDSNGNYVGTEFLVNTYTTGDQWVPTVASDPTGNFVVTWTSQDQDGNGEGIFAQRYAANGSPLGTEFQVNSTTANDQAYSSVADRCAWKLFDNLDKLRSGRAEHKWHLWARLSRERNAVRV